MAPIAASTLSTGTTNVRPAVENVDTNKTVKNTVDAPAEEEVQQVNEVGHELVLKPADILKMTD
jgi:hypothetical protein